MSTRAKIAVSREGAGASVDLVEVDLPDPTGNQVLVEIGITALCHSQLHHLAAPQRMVMGHEATGFVAQVGTDVDSVSVGETVLVTWVPKDPDQADRAAPPASVALPDGDFAVSPNVYTWGSHVLVDEMYVVPLPADIDLDVASVLGCAVITGAGAVLHTAQVQAGESVAIIGVGGVGLCAVAAASKLGADPIIAVDLSNQKLEMAMRFGATHGVNAAAVDDPIAAVRALTPGEGLDFVRQPVAGPDYVFDCIGKPATVAQALQMVRPGRYTITRGGMAVVVGVPTAQLELPPAPLLVGERTLIGSIGGSCSPSSDVPRFIDWWKEGDLDLDHLVTVRYPIERINDAVSDLKEGRIEGRALLEV